MYATVGPIPKTTERITTLHMDWIDSDYHGPQIKICSIELKYLIITTNTVKE